MNRSRVTMAVVVSVAVLSMVFAAPGQASWAEFEASPLPSPFDAFGDDNTTDADWTAGDGTYSVPLADGRRVWLFGDSWAGSIDPVTHARTPAPPIFAYTNHVVVQGQDTGLGPGALTSVFPNGHAAPAFKSTSGDCILYWPHAGVEVAPNRIQVTLGCIKVYSLAPITLHASRVDLWELAEVDGKWVTTQIGPLSQALTIGDRTSCTHDGSRNDIQFGSAIVPGGSFDHNGHQVAVTWVYGLEAECAPGDSMNSYIHVAAVLTYGTSSRLDGYWVYLTPDGEAVDRPGPATRLRQQLADEPPELFGHGGAEYSVTRTDDGAYRLITSDIGVGPIRRYRAATPWGPWTAPSDDESIVYSPPELESNQVPVNDPFGTPGVGDTCVLSGYGAKEHAGLGTDHRPVVSYNRFPVARAGATTYCDIPGAANADANNYRPQFVAVAP